jgi:immune inhibitor A
MKNRTAVFFVVINLALVQASFSPLITRAGGLQMTNPSYLNQYPPAERVKAYVRNADLTEIGAEHGARAGSPALRGTGARGHVKPLPNFVEKAEAARVKAAELVARGQAAPDANGFVTLRNGKRVRYRLQGVEYMTVALVDFSDVTHGNLPEPDRQTDNATYWSADVSPAHYNDMLFTAGGGGYGLPSMRDFYLQQSSGRFTWAGQVSNWVQIDGTEADYGADGRTGGVDSANGPWYRIVDAALKAVASNGYAGLDLTRADQVDRYDCDGDGIYYEPDGYIDHFAVVHAGSGQEHNAGDNALFSHRGYANYNESTGPAGCKLGGYQLPGTNLWVGDYTLEPEDGGVGVFAHEFGHDLGLPDLYDFSAGADTGAGFWSLMGSGNWASESPNALGDKPVHMGAWEKLALGWLGDKLAVASLGQDVTIDLGPAEFATRKRFQALRVNLPDYGRPIQVFPAEGTDVNYFYSTRGDAIDTSMSRTLPAPLTSATDIQFRANWDIETGWDYAYLIALVNGSWQTVQTTASTTTDPNGQNFGFGITGVSGQWTTVGAVLPAGTAAYGFRYWTDAFVTKPGFAVDTISFQGTTDHATDTAGWTLNGFAQLSNGIYRQPVSHYYLVESRSYVDNDASLCGAFNLLFGNWVERQCYADGLLIWYRNSGYADNNTSQHPGYGQILPVDAHPAPRVQPDGRTLWYSRWQTWDSTFGVEANSVTLSQYMKSGTLLQETYTAEPVWRFYDDPSGTAYWNAEIPNLSVKTPGTGLRLDILGVSPDLGSYRVRVYN